MSADSPGGVREAWIVTFVDYVISLRPGAAPDLVAAAASERHTRLGEFDPVDVAEAEWNFMELGDQG